MTVNELIEQLQDMKQHTLPGNAYVLAYDPDTEKIVKITGLLQSTDTVTILTDTQGG